MHFQRITFTVYLLTPAVNYELSLACSVHKHATLAIFFMYTGETMILGEDCVRREALTSKLVQLYEDPGVAGPEGADDALAALSRRNVST